jgi:hypothetical protein
LSAESEAKFCLAGNVTSELRENLGSARASRAGFGASPKRSFRETIGVHFYCAEEVRDGEGAIASTRGRVRSPDSKK